jgi:ribonuclease HI
VWFQKWESNDWKTANGKSVDNRDLVEPILERIRERLQAGAKTVFQWVKGHSTDPGNIAADQLAVQGAEMGRQIIAERENQEEAEKSRQRLGRFDGQVGADVGGEGVPEQEQHEGEWAWINDVRNHAQES